MFLAHIQKSKPFHPIDRPSCNLLRHDFVKARPYINPEITIPFSVPTLQFPYNPESSNRWQLQTGVDQRCRIHWKNFHSSPSSSLVGVKTT